MMDGKPDLRPCPFCGGDEIYVFPVAASRGRAAMCQKCLAEGPYERTKGKAAEAWNRREVPENRALLAAEADGGGNGAFAMGGVTMHESLIQALRFCASGEKFPRLCTEACPLYCAKGNAKTCVACIDSLLRQAADALENNKMGGEK